MAHIFCLLDALKHWFPTEHRSLSIIGGGQCFGGWLQGTGSAAVRAVPMPHTSMLNEWCGMFSLSLWKVGKWERMSSPPVRFKREILQSWGNLEALSDFRPCSALWNGTYASSHRAFWTWPPHFGRSGDICNNNMTIQFFTEKVYLKCSSKFYTNKWKLLSFEITGTNESYNLKDIIFIRKKNLKSFYEIKHDEIILLKNSLNIKKEENPYEYYKHA